MRTKLWELKDLHRLILGAHLSPKEHERLFQDINGDLQQLGVHLSSCQGQGSPAKDKDVARLRHKLKTLRERCGAKIRALRKEVKTLRHTVRNLAKEAETLRYASRRVASPALQKENSALQRSLGAQTIRLVEMKSALRNMDQHVSVQEEQITALMQANKTQTETIVFLQRELAQAHAESIQVAVSCEKAGTSECPGPLLCGKRILYVGGRAGLIRQYKELVERLGGIFHHCCGESETVSPNLDQLMVEADAVFCPEEALGGKIGQRIQEVCGQGSPMLTLLKDSDISSLSRCLKDMALQQ